MNEQEKFLKDLEPDNKLKDLFEAPLTGETKEPVKEETLEDPEKAPEDIKNRAHRRLEKKLQEEREANIQMAAKLEVLSEIRRSKGEEPSEYMKRVELIYGNQSPEAQTATDILKEALKGVKEEAKAEALELLKEENRKAQQEIKAEESNLDSMLEDIEDQYGGDITSNKELQKAFFSKLEKVSPKDRDGNILQYADHLAVFEDLQSQIQKKTDNSRAKDISSRSMVKSGSSESTLKNDAMEKQLKEMGII